MSDKKKHHSFRISLPAREVMRRLQLYVANNDFATLEIHTVDIAGYDLTFKGTRISFREDADTEDTIVFVEQDGSEGNVSVANELEHYLDDDKYHQFHIPISVRTVMQYVRAKYNQHQFSEMGIGNYDFILKQRRGALLPDNDHNGTTVLVERNDDLAAELEHLLIGNKHLQNPIRLTRSNKWLARLMGGSVTEIRVDAPPDIVVEHLLSQTHPAYHLHVTSGDEIGIYHLQANDNMDAPTRYPNIDATFYIQLGASDKQTEIIVKRSGTGYFLLSMICCAFTLLWLANLGNGNYLGFLCFAPITIFFAAHELQKYFLYRAFDSWLHYTLQNISQETEKDIQAKENDMPYSEIPDQTLSSSAKKLS